MLASELITSLNKAIAVGGDFEVNDYSPIKTIPVEQTPIVTGIVTGTGPAIIKPEKVVVKQPGRKRKGN